MCATIIKSGTLLLFRLIIDATLIKGFFCLCMPIVFIIISSAHLNIHVSLFARSMEIA